MVLATFDDHRSEQELSLLLESFDFGTPAFHVYKLTQIGYTIQYQTFTFPQVAAYLSRGLHPIVFVDASMLPWADFDGFHALVLVEVTAQDVAVHDPTQTEGPSRLLIDGFLAAWKEFDDKAAIISLQ